MRKRSRLPVLLALAALLALPAFTAACGDDASAELPTPQDLPQETATAYVYFATGRTLVEEPRVIDATRPYDEVLSELMQAQPEINSDIAIVQPQAEILGTSLDDEGVFTIDWSQEILDFEATDEEKGIALAAFLRTMGQFPEVEKVRFTVEGQTEGEIDGKDIEQFWGYISLAGQPWDVFRPQPRDEVEGSDEATATPDGAPAETTSTTVN